MITWSRAVPQEWMGTKGPWQVEKEWVNRDGTRMIEFLTLGGPYVSPAERFSPAVHIECLHDTCSEQGVAKIVPREDIGTHGVVCRKCMRDMKQVDLNPGRIFS